MSSPPTLLRPGTEQGQALPGRRGGDGAGRGGDMKGRCHSDGLRRDPRPPRSWHRGDEPARPGMGFHVPSCRDTRCIGACSFPGESWRCAVSGGARCHVSLQLVGAVPLILMGFGSGPEFSAVLAKRPPQAGSPLVLD